MPGGGGSSGLSSRSSNKKSNDTNLKSIREKSCKITLVMHETALPGRSGGGGGRDGGSGGEEAGESGSPGILGRGAGMIFFNGWGCSARESSCLSCHWA